MGLGIGIEVGLGLGIGNWASESKSENGDWGLRLGLMIGNKIGIWERDCD